MLPRGLDSVTVAPGNTAPDESVMVPPIAPTPCANTGGAEHAHTANATTIVSKRGEVIVIPSCQRDLVRTVRLEREHTSTASVRRKIRRGAGGANRVDHATARDRSDG